MRFKKFLEYVNPGAFVQSDVTPFGSGRSLELPSHIMNDMSTTITGRVIDVEKIKGRSVVDREEGNSKLIIKVKTPRGIHNIEYQKGNIPAIGKPITLTLDREGKVINYK